ncbi:MAG: hypothetical protein WAQ27_02845 [Candidatus Microsaccharimonas sp.]
MKRSTRIGGIAAAASLTALTIVGVALPAQAATDKHIDDLSDTSPDQCVAEPEQVIDHEEVSHLDEVITPGAEEVSHIEQRWSREVPGVEAAYRFFRTNPGQNEVSHQEFKYQQSQFRTRTRTPLFGEVEHKSTKGWQFVDGGSVTINGHHVSGHWVQGEAGTFYVIPDSVINAVWGAGGIPDQYMGSGTVNLRTYGGPNVNTQYNAYKEQTQAGFTDWGPWSEWSTTNPGVSTDTLDVQNQTVNYNDGNWTTDVDPAGWTKTDEQKVMEQDAIAPFTEYRKLDGSVSTNPDDAGWFTQSTAEGWSQYGEGHGAVPGYTEYYVPGGEPTRELSDSNWTTDAPEDWTFVDDRKVVTQEATPPVITYVKVVDEEAWSETIPAGFEGCTLPETGGSIPWGPASIGVLLASAGVASVVLGSRRARRLARQG